MRGIIVKHISNDYTVESDNRFYVCKARGKMRKLNISPIVGDKVIFDENDKVILDVLPRKNYLLRPPVANIDEVLIITSLKNPNFDSHLLDKLLVVTEWNNITPIIVFTKSDLININDFKEIINYYKNIGYEVYLNTEIDKIKKVFKDKVSVFAGQSGAGKSTLLNKISPDLDLKTGEISLALNRGRHTTRHTELIKINGGYVADTPGFSALELTDMTNSDIRDNFTEFNFYRGECKYRDCMHDKEDNCMVKKQVDEGNILKSRYENYLNFIHRK